MTPNTSLEGIAGLAHKARPPRLAQANRSERPGQSIVDPLWPKYQTQKSKRVSRPLENSDMPKLSLFITLLAFASCSRSGQGTPGEPAAISPETSFGTVLIHVLEAGHPEHYWQYEVQPTGTVRMVKETSFADYAHEDIPRTFQEPAGAIGAYAGTPQIKAPSPVGLYSAHCENAGVLEVSLASVGSPVAE
jgi:hypothetical protein